MSVAQQISPSKAPREKAKEQDTWPIFNPIPGRTIDHLITEYDDPVDNPEQDKQCRLWVNVLYASQSWLPAGVEKLAVGVDIGMFPDYDSPGRAADLLVSLGVEFEYKPGKSKDTRSYFFWKYGKPPELVAELVSNIKGAELASKMTDYAAMKIPYYVVYDPMRFYINLKDENGEMEPPVRAYELNEKTGRYRQMDELWFPKLNLGLRLWNGEFEGMKREWLRWTDADHQLLPTGEELVEKEAKRAEKEAKRAEQESKRAEQESKRAEQESKRAEQESKRAAEESKRAEEEKKRAEKLAKKLQDLGVDPNDL